MDQVARCCPCCTSSEGAWRRIYPGTSVSRHVRLVEIRRLCFTEVGGSVYHSYMAGIQYLHIRSKVCVKSRIQQALRNQEFACWEPLESTAGQAWTYTRRQPCRSCYDY